MSPRRLYASIRILIDDANPYCISMVLGRYDGKYPFLRKAATPSASQNAALRACNEATVGKPDIYGRYNEMDSCTPLMTYCSDGFVIEGDSPSYTRGGVKARVYVTQGTH